MARHEPDDLVLEPLKYLSQIPGKNLRSALIDCFQTWYNIEDEKLQGIKDIIGGLHDASLLIDDIEDNSKVRRGMPTAHSIFGVPSTINCANYAYFLALEKINIHLDNNNNAICLFTQEVLNLHRGQGQDILWREQCVCPTEEQYRRMILDKTGGLFRMAIGLMKPFATTNIDEDFNVLLNLLAEYFQIRDDLLNIANEEYMKSKIYCEDLTEGKFSFPVIYAIKKDVNDTRLLNILRQRTDDDKIKMHAVQYMTEVGALTYTRKRLTVLKDQAQVEIDRLGGHSKLVAWLAHLDAKIPQF
jgi:geranylgeranyl diphosphate synthase type 3